MTRKLNALFIVIVTAFAVSVLPKEIYAATDTDTSHLVYLERANAYIKSYRHFPAADALRQAAKMSGDQHPSIYMRLAILYYGLGFIPEAIAAGEKAVTLAPNMKWYKYDLAKFYFVDKQLEKARDQFMALLQIDPGFTLGYVYLGEVYFQLGNYNMAWICSERADALGHDGTLLREKLKSVSGKPGDDFVPYSQNNNTYFRFIKLASENEANTVLKQIEGGKSFENLELELQNEKSFKADFGIITLAELDQAISKSLQNVQPFAKPAVVKTGSEFRIMQRILPFERSSWEKLAKTSSPARPATRPTVVAAAQTEIAPIKEVTSPSPAIKPEPAMTKTATQPVMEPDVSSSQQAAVKGPTSASGEQEILAALRNWKQVWEKANVSEYFKCYSADFSPSNQMSLNEWKKKRAANISAPKRIEIILSNPHVEQIDASSAEVSFTQTYRSDRINDVVEKKLSLHKEATGWKIVSEEVASTISQ